MTLQYPSPSNNLLPPTPTFVDSQQDEMANLLLRVFIRIEPDGVPTMDVSAPPEVLHYLFPQTPHPGFDPCPFTIQLVPKNKQQQFSDLTTVLNTRQLKPNEDHYRIMPSRGRVLELINQQREVYPPPSAHPTHLRRDRSRTPDDPEIASLPGYRRIWIYPVDVSGYLVKMGYKYMGSHAEACDSHRGDIWDIHTFAAGPRLERIFAMMTPPMTETSPETVGTPRIGAARVTFQEPELIKSSFE
ncbi:hypothetical protein QFC20_002233 [Naganishia adeliensis]|uniref:Uncharacterized protein n=1 Tax=Naganishia adeliensis TaxID=92952 RepID=A0ACC2WM72_9TREE|nr:hypothetical protein QFC20_002233 [Naganishia adeliensis]